MSQHPEHSKKLLEPYFPENAKTRRTLSTLKQHSHDNLKVYHSDWRRVNTMLLQKVASDKDLGLLNFCILFFFFYYAS